MSNSSSNPGEQKFYAVQNGKVPGVYTDWTQAQAQIRGIRKPKHRKFSTRAEAEAFVAAGRKDDDVEPPKTMTAEEEIRSLIVRNSAPGLHMNGTYAPVDKDGNPYDIAQRPLPPGAEDGYDPNVKLAADGTIVERADEEKTRTKMVSRERDPPGMLRIYTDGSSLGNGQAGARAGVGVFFGPQDSKYEDPPVPPAKCNPKSQCRRRPPRPTSPSRGQLVYRIDWTARSDSRRRRGQETEAETKEEERLTNPRDRNVSEALKGSKQTNQRAELTAILRALDIAPRHREVTIYTDSKYAIDCVTNWYRNWKKNGWLNAKGKPVENKDLVVDIRDKIDERDEFKKSTYFVWVKGHKDNAGNIAADRLAVEGALKGVAGGGDALGQSGGGEPARADGRADDAIDGHDGEDDETKAAFKAMERAMEEDSDDEFK